MTRSGRSVLVSPKKDRRPDHWMSEACQLIEHRIADALLHATAGDLGAATGRLTELAASLNRVIRDARADFYHRSFAAHIARGLDPRIHRTDVAPTAEGEAAARDARILGRHVGDDVGKMASEAKSLLRLTAGRGDSDNDALATWQKVESASFRAFAQRSLTDSRTAIHHAVGRVLIKPELRA